MKTKQRIAGGLLILGLGIWVAKGFLLQPPPFFPDIPSGAYVGTVTGIDATPNTFYLERFEKTDTFLVVLFRDGFKPQAVFGEHVEKQLRPLVVVDRSMQLTFTGASSENRIAGVVRDNEGKSGSWELRSLTPQELLAPSDAEALTQLKKWLVAREENRRIKVAIRESEALLADGEHKRDRLKLLLEDEGALREKAIQRRTQLSQELKRAIEERKATSDTVDGLVSELDLLGRITKRGQIVALARRVMNRENKWYDVNWKANEDASGLEDSAEVPPEIDLANLDAAVKRANEVRALLRERDEEVRRINELEEPRGEVGPGLEPPPIPPPLKEEEERDPNKSKNLWNRIFG